MRGESFNPNLINPGERLPRHEKFDPRKTIYRTSGENPTGADPKEIMEGLRKKISAQEIPVSAQPPAIDAHPELNPNQAREFEKARDAVLEIIRRERGEK